jgi:hypothetical protein
LDLLPPQLISKAERKRSRIAIKLREKNNEVADIAFWYRKFFDQKQDMIRKLTTHQDRIKLREIEEQTR